MHEFHTDMYNGTTMNDNDYKLLHRCQIAEERIVFYCVFRTLVGFVDERPVVHLE